MACQPRHMGGRATAKGSHGRPSKLGCLVGWARAPLTYRVTQVLTGHRCFGKYLHRIRKEATARCHHCDASVDSAQHTLEFCPAWARLRRDLVVEIGWDLSPQAILAALLGSERGRRAVTSFCEQVMLRKEAAERVRSSHPERIDRWGRVKRRGHAWTRRFRAAAPPGGGQSYVLINHRLRIARQFGRGTRLLCTAAPEMMHFYAREGPGVSFAPVPGPLSIAAVSVIVEILVGWSPALPHH